MLFKCYNQIIYSYRCPMWKLINPIPKSKRPKTKVSFLHSYQCINVHSMCQYIKSKLPKTISFVAYNKDVNYFCKKKLINCMFMKSCVVLIKCILFFSDNGNSQHRNKHGNDQVLKVTLEMWVLILYLGYKSIKPISSWLACQNYIYSEVSDMAYMLYQEEIF